jgi:hypothetical protein
MFITLLHLAPRHACNLSPRLRSSLLILYSREGDNLIDRLEGRSKDAMYAICGPKANSLSKSLINLGHPNVFLA